MPDEAVVETPIEPVKTEPVTETKPVEKPIDPQTMKSEELKALIEKPPADKPVETAEVKKEEPVKDEWFDKEKGFKTKEDALKSYSSAQEALRQKAEQLKQKDAELAALKAKAVEVPLTVEEQDKQKQIEGWKEQNKEAINFLTAEIKKNLEKENLENEFKNAAIKARQDWKTEFDKDNARKALWPKMEEIYAKQDVFQDFAKNPLSYIEAVALKENLPSILEKVRSEAVEQYKESLKQTAEAEKKSKTATPGGPKSLSGDVDVSKMSASDLASLLPRSEEG